MYHHAGSGDIITLTVLVVALAIVVALRILIVVIRARFTLPCNETAPPQRADTREPARAARSY